MNEEYLSLVMRVCLRKSELSYISLVLSLFVCLFLFLVAQNPLCLFTCMLFDQLVPRLLEGKYSHLCCSYKCKYYGYVVSYSRGGSEAVIANLK